ncbi:MAG: hypothetical protein KatS3mg059_0367 [Thermomicrobiales bacterium]|nr:MAG: hypothetical protein KatS3mg059_0367 [Thermomicrobiales bacterium]
MPKIARLSALEILDSRGRPTVRATCELASGAAGSASVPSGASTGSAEALELRDGDRSRYGGLGCRKAVANITGPIASALTGRDWPAQEALDEALIALDGTPTKSHLGANAILAVSLAFARAAAAECRLPLYRYFATLIGPGHQPVHLPRPTINLFSGGKHAGGQVEIQDVLVVVPAASTIDQALATTYAVYQAAAEICRIRYHMRALVADEGGLAPEFPSVEQMLDDAVAAIRQTGYEPGREVALCVDVAASHFHAGGRYHIGGAVLSSAEMIDRLAGWLDHYPIVSIEDGLAEDDWEHWPALRHRLSGRGAGAGRRPADDEPGAHPARDHPGRCRCLAAQGEPDWNVDRSGRGVPAGAWCRMARRRECPQRGKRKTTGWRTWQLAGAARRSRSARSRARNAWRSGTACSRSRRRPAGRSTSGQDTAPLHKRAERQRLGTPQASIGAVDPQLRYASKMARVPRDQHQVMV